MSEKTVSGLTRRAAIGSISAGIGLNTLSGLNSAVSTGETQYVGKTYDPLTDKQQGDATAVLNIQNGELSGRIEAAGFNITVGQQSKLDDQSSHPRVNTFTFEKSDEAFTVKDNGEEIPLTGRLHHVDGKIAGTLRRPSPEYGKIAFSFLPSQRGFSSATVGSALDPNGKQSLVTNPDEVTIPDKGIPTSNSLKNAPPKPEVRTDGCGDVGVLDSQDRFGDIYQQLPSDCSDDSAYMSWDYSFATSAQVRYQDQTQCENIYTDYDEIAEGGGFKRYRLKSFFESTPDPLVKSCDQETGFPYQTSVNFGIRQADTTTKNDADLSDPSPDDKDETTNPGDGILGLALNIVNSVTGVWGSIGTAVIDYALSSDSESDITVGYDDLYNGTNKELYTWDLVLDGYYDAGLSPYFADSSDNTAGADIKVENGSAPGNTHNLKSRAEHEFGHYKYHNDSCPCEKFATTFVISSTGVHENYLEYTAVDI